MAEVSEFLTKYEIPLPVLSDAEYALWAYIVQLPGDSGLSAIISNLVQTFPTLYAARNDRGVMCLDLATPVYSLAIKSMRLWFGRYHIDDTPEHQSATCFVYKALDAQANDSVVALKLMRYRSHFLKELKTRKCVLDSGMVVAIINSFPTSDQNVGLNEDCFASQDEAVQSLTHLTKGQAEKMFCMVMPWAERNMFVSLKQDGYTGGRNLSEVRYIFNKLLLCVEHLHDKFVLHADLKPLNIVRQGGSWKLIDMDANCTLMEEYVGSKSSTAYVPPEALFVCPEQDIVCTRSHANLSKLGLAFDLLVADPSYDVWALGCILYQMCSVDGRPLFQGGRDDNLTDDQKDYDNNLWTLATWSDEVKSHKLSFIHDDIAKNLISLMLHVDPSRRPTIPR